MPLPDHFGSVENFIALDTLEEHREVDIFIGAAPVQAVAEFWNEAAEVFPVTGVDFAVPVQIPETNVARCRFVILVKGFGIAIYVVIPVNFFLALKDAVDYPAVKRLNRLANFGACNVEAAKVGVQARVNGGIRGS